MDIGCLAVYGALTFLIGYIWWCMKGIDDGR